MTEYCEKINDFSHIPNIEYVGYIWMSDKSAPQAISNINELPTTTNPYIVEGNLYCKEKDISISIRNTGDKLFITKIDLNAAENDASVILEPQTFIAHRAPNNHKKVCFKQAWIAEKDDYCEGMHVLQPAWRAFVGFDTEKTNQKK